MKARFFSIALLVMAWIPAALNAQSAPLAPQDLSSANAATPANARLEGQVLTETGNTPLRRVRVTLRPRDSGQPAIAVETDERGTFVIRDIAAGVYSISATRDGYLQANTFRRGAVRMPQQFSLQGDEHVTDLSFHLRPWAVVTGKIKYEDADPAVNLQIALYREYHVRGRHGFTSVATAVTNDRGEYRVHGLPAGSYYVAVVMEGDSGDAAGSNRAHLQIQPRVDDKGREVQTPSYTTMFYPDTTRLSEAVPIRIKAGEEINGIDMYLRTVQRVNLSGQITDGLTGASLRGATIIMERLDSSNTGVLPTPMKAGFDNADRFHITGVAPGWYQLWVDAQSEAQRLVGRSMVLVTNSGIDDLKLVALPQRQWRGEVLFPPGATPLRDFQPNVVLEPRSERGAVATGVLAKNGSFDVALMPNDTYDVFVRNLPDDYYISQIRVGGSDTKLSGLTGSMASDAPFQVVVDSRGGRIDGQVQGPNASVWSGANLTLIPEVPDGHLQDYKDAFADVNGQFHMTGVAPGRYILTAWFDEQPCDVYDPDDFGACRAAGIAVTVGQSSQQSVALVMKTQ